MTAIVMEVTHAMQHPKADSLRLYKMAAPGLNEVQIIANLENVYEVGDHVEVVLSGSTLKDGTAIRDSKIRDIVSYGMALGVSDLAVGTDITDKHCKDDTINGFRMQKWTEIESLFNVRRSLAATDSARSVTYATKVKLDGTNAGVQVSKDGRVAAQSRTKIITPEDDNAGFARWVADNRDYFAGLVCDKHMTIFGEWCGQGIQGGTAIAQVDHKLFAVFAIQYGGVDGEPAVLDVNPWSILDRLGGTPKSMPRDVLVLPFYSAGHVIDFADAEKLKAQAEELNALVKEVEACDPWVKAIFGIEGIGEGLVFYPMPAEAKEFEPIFIDALYYSDLVFKAKGEKHKTTKSKKAVQIDAEIAKNVSDFVFLFMTDARLNQMLSDIDLDIKNTGIFVKAFVSDVKKESSAELDSSGLEWKNVAKELAHSAGKWFVKKCNQP